MRYRIDGLLDEVATIKGNDLSEQIISRLKVLAGARHRRAGASRRTVRSALRPAAAISICVFRSCRVCMAEDAVIRILDKQRMVEASGRLTLDVLASTRARSPPCVACSNKPYGMVLVTGRPAAARPPPCTRAGRDQHRPRQNHHDRDPVEYQIPGIRRSR